MTLKEAMTILQIKIIISNNNNLIKKLLMAYIKLMKEDLVLIQIVQINVGILLLKIFLKKGIYKNFQQEMVVLQL